MESPDKKMRLKRKPLNEQQELVVRLRGEGQTNESIAAQLGLSRERIRQVFADAQKRLRAWAADPDGRTRLPARVSRMLQLYGLESRAAVAEAIDSGKMRWEEKHGGRLLLGDRHMRDFGWHCWVVLNEWVGRPLPQRNRFFTCPHCGGKIPQ